MYADDPLMFSKWGQSNWCTQILLKIDNWIISMLGADEAPFLVVLSSALFSFYILNFQIPVFATLRQIFSSVMSSNA